MLRHAATVLCSVVLLAGCGSDDPTPKEPDKTAVAVPDMPDQAREEGSEGAAAFVVYYVDLMTYAANTGDVAPIKKVTAEECGGCFSYINEFEKTYQNGGRIDGADFRLGEPLIVRDRGVETVVSGDLTVSQLAFQPSSDSEPTIEPTATSRMTFGAERRGNKWRVRQIFLGDPQ